jgi:hypothetical protein
MGDLIHDLLDSVNEDALVRQALVGVHWTAVCS